MFEGWEGPGFSSSIAQYGCLKVSLVVLMLQRLSSYSTFSWFVSTCCIKFDGILVFMDPLIHKVSASLFWQDSTGWFWFLLVRLCTFGNQLICSSLLPLNFRYVSGFWTTLVFIWFWIVYIALKHHRHRDASFIFWSSQLAHHRSHAIYKMGAGKCVW